VFRVEALDRFPIRITFFCWFASFDRPTFHLTSFCSSSSNAVRSIVGFHHFSSVVAVVVALDSIATSGVSSFDSISLNDKYL
jgi:hypothetical protein